MATTYTPIATTTLTSTTGSVTFSSLGSYTDLVIYCSYTCPTNSNIYLTINNDSGANYAAVYQAGTGGATTAHRLGTIYTNTNTTVSNATQDYFEVWNYLDTTAYKTITGRHITPGTNITQFSGAWYNTAAITSIRVNSTASFSSGSTFHIYGITKA